MADLAPIALFVYNRPDHTKLTIDALLRNSESSQSELFVFSDAAKTSVHQPAVAQVRKFIRNISGFKQVTIVEREENWGLAKSIIDGVTQLCNQHGKVIVLEDDLVVSPHFLDFMNISLLKYADEDRVMQIAGYMYPINFSSENDALLLPMTSSWGWATWHRAWKSFDDSASGYEDLKSNRALKKKFDLEGKYPYFKMLEAMKHGKLSSWAIRWYLSVFLRDGLVLYPKKSLVNNNGFDGSGVNCIVSAFDATLIDSAFKVLSYPDEIKTSTSFEDIKKKMPKPRFNIKALTSRVAMLIKSRVISR